MLQATSELANQKIVSGDSSRASHIEWDICGGPGERTVIFPGQILRGGGGSETPGVSHFPKDAFGKLERSKQILKDFGCLWVKPLLKMSRLSLLGCYTKLLLSSGKVEPCFSSCNLRPHSLSCWFITERLGAGFFVESPKKRMDELEEQSLVLYAEWPGISKI